MKTFLSFAALGLLAAGSLHAQQQAEAFLVYEEGDIERVWLTAASATGIRYKETEVAVDTKDAKISEFQTIYILEPVALTEAIDLFQGRKYAEAKEKLAAVATAYKALEELPDNPSTNASYLTLECLRRSGDLEGLAKALETFDKGGLTREHQLRQLELYAMWDAVRTKDWPRLENIASERLKERMPGYQRAQVGYCLGLALDSQDKIVPAINAYNIALTADTGASEDITRTAAANALRLYKKDPGVQTAIKLWGSKDENPNTSGHQMLVEAGALASLYELSLGGGTPLPDEAKDLLKYKPQVAAKAEAAPKVEGK
jgi:hypothetical protein